MDNAQGKKIYYGIVLDNAQLRQDAEQSKNIFRGIGDASTASASRIDNAYKSVSGTLMKLGAAVSAVELAKGIYNFADRFERSMAEVTTISETVTNNLGKFKQEIIKMSTEIPVPADEAAKALYQIVSAGHDGAAGLEVLRVSAKAAVGGVTETVTAADAITSILNAYKKGAGEAENISDQLFTTVRLGKTTMGELGHSISQAIPIAASFGIESEQVLAAIATLTKSGTPTAQAVTQVRSAIKAASEQLGDGYFKTHTFQQGLQEIATKAGGSEAKLRALVPEIEAMNGILGLTGINAQTAASDLEELTKSAGATEAAFQKMASETSSQLTILKNNVLAEFSELGESMVDNVGKVAAALNEAFDTGKIDKLLSVLGSLIAAYGTYKATLIAISAIERVALLARQVREYVQMARALGLATANQIAFNRAALMNPYTAIAGAIAAVVGGLVLYSTRTSDAERASKSLGTAIDEETSRLDKAYDAIHKAKEGTEERKTAIDNFNRDYGRYLDNLLSEKSAIEEVAAAYDKAKTAVADYAIEKARESYMAEPLADADKAKAGLRNSASKWIDKLGDAGKSGAFMSDIDELIRRIEGGEVFSEGAIYQALDNAFAKQAGFKDNSYHGVKSKEFALEFQREAENLQTAAKEFEAFSEAYRKATVTTVTQTEISTTEIKTYAGQVKETAETIKRLRSELADLRAGKGDVPDPAAAIIAKEKELKEAKSRYKTLLYGDSDDSGKTIVRQSKYDEQIRQEAIQRQRAEEDLEISVQQARIDAKEDGIDKVLAQNELNHKRELLDIERQKQDLLKAIQDQERTIWEAKNPDWEKKGLKFIPTIMELPKETLEKFDKLLETAKNKKQKSDVDFLSVQFDQEVVDWNEYYKKYGTFRERLQATKDEYDRKMQEAKNTGEKAALQTEMDEVLAEFEVEASGFVEELTNKTTGKLETMLKNAQKQLDVAQKKFKSLDSSTSTEAKQYKDFINKLQAQIKALQNQLGKAKETASDKDWAQSSELFQAISSGARDAAEGVRDFDEGLADVLTTIANITAGIGGMIAAITAIGAAASAAEKASAILAVIAAAIQIVSGLFSIFSAGETAVEKTCREFAELNDELIRLKREAAINSWEDTIFGADVWKNASENMKIYVEAFERYNNTLEDIRNRGQEVYVDFQGRNSDWVVTEKANLDKMAKTWETAAQSISNMQVQTRHSTWFRSAKYASLGSLLPGIFNEDGTLNMDALKEFQGNDLYKKLTKENRAFIDALISDWELYEEAFDEVKGYLSDIFGDLGETITDVLVDAFANGTDAAKGFADSVSEMLENLAKDMIYSVTLAPLMEKAQKDMLAIMGDAGLSDDQKFEKYAGVLAYLTDEALAQQENADYLMKLYQEMAAQKGIDIFQPDGDREASSKGIDTASQDSVEELNGRFTAIQGHTFDIRAAVNAIASSKTQDLMKIEINTERLHTIDANVFGIREASNLLVANSARMLQHLAGIEDNTSNLLAMRDDLSGIRNELRAELSSVRYAVGDMTLKGLKLKR